MLGNVVRHTALLLLGVPLVACGGLAGTPSTPGDTTRPTVTLTSSAANVTKGGDIVLSADAQDAGGIAKVVFYDKGKKLGEDTAAPYTFTVGATATLSGQHIYTAQAFDKAGLNMMSNPVAVTVNIADTSVGELLTNGTFQTDANPWWTAGVPAPTVQNGEACLNVANPGTNTYDVIFGQSGVGLTQGASYSVSFTARADVPTAFKVLLQLDAAPYTAYFEQQIGDVSTTAKAYNFSFTMQNPDDAKAVMQFQLGGQKATRVCLSNVSVRGPKFGAGVGGAAVDDRATVRVNQVGYLPTAPKLATIAHDSAVPLDWNVLDQSGKVLASGKTKIFGADAASGEHVHQADFSGVTAPGDGDVLEVAGLRSHPFRISKDIYATLKYDALAYFYHNRSGIPIEAQYVGDAKWARPAGHVNVAPNQGDAGVTCFHGADAKGNLWPGCDYTLNAQGGWYDAGDQGKYVVNGGVAAWTLLNEYEWNARRGGVQAFADGKLRIPERANGQNDLLDEARWEMDFLMAMQVPDGKTLQLPVGDQSGHVSALKFSPVDASGMAHHKLHDVAWTGLPLRPDQDPQPRFLYPPSTAATLNLAATAAQCARVFRGVNDAYAQKCLESAQRAWAAARRNPAVYAYDVNVGGGGYADTDVSDEFYWAAAELYATTGQSAYLDALKGSPLYLKATKGDLSHDLAWPELTTAGTITLALAPNQLPAADVATAKNNLIAAANAYVQDVSKEGYGLPFSSKDYPWGSNSNVLNRGLVLGTAYGFTGNLTYLNAALEGMNYLLGRNPMDKSYVSGYGARPLTNPHHRFWAHELDASFPLSPAGALSGGPNSDPSDPIASKLAGKCAPQTCYVDDTGAYSVNEVAINWNAPLAWVAAFLDQAANK